MKQKNKFIFILLIITLITIFITFLIKRPPETPQKMDKVNIAASMTLSPALIWIADDLGFFKQQGLDATIKQYSSGKTTTEAMLKGEADISASAEFLAVKKAQINNDLRILATTAFVHQIKLLGLKAQGIERITDIKGKRIGVRMGTNGEYFLSRLLTLNSMKKEDIQWVNISPQEKLNAMTKGDVDGVITWPPFVQQIQNQLADRVVVFDGQPGQDYYYLLLTRKDWIEENSAVAEKVLKALKLAQNWVNQKPQEARNYISKKFNISEEKIEQILKEYRYSISLPQTLLIAMESEKNWLENQKPVGKQTPINFLNLISFDPLEKISPESVTITH